MRWKLLVPRLAPRKHGKVLNQTIIKGVHNVFTASCTRRITASIAMSNDHKMKDMAKEAQSWVVYARIKEAFDATVADLYYHQTCYLKLSNEARAAKSKKSKKTKSQTLPYDDLVVAEFIAFIQCNESVMKLTYHRQLYSQRLKQVTSDG